MLFKKFIKIIIWFCLGLTIVCLFLFINLPYIVESQIQKKIPPFFGPDNIEFHIQKIGFSNIVISRIRMGKAISIDLINIDYNIKGLSSVHLTGVTLSGLQLHAQLDENNQIKLSGLKFPDTANNKGNQPDVSFVSFLPEKIIIQNAQMILHTKKDDFVIPFDVISKIDSKDGKIFAKTRLYPFGQKINTLVNYDLNKGIQSLKIEGKSFDLMQVGRFISKKTNGVQLKGRVDFYLETASPEKQWKLNVSRVGFVHPIEADIQQLTAIILIDGHKVNARGTFNLSHSVLAATQMEYTLNFDLKKQHSFDLKVESSKTKACQMAYGSLAGTFKNPKLNAWFKGTPLIVKGEIALNMNQGIIHHQKNSLVFANARIILHMATDFTDKGNGVSSKLRFTVNNLKSKSGSMTSTFPFSSLSGSLFLDKTYKPSGNLTLKASQGKISIPEFKAKASDVNIEVPIQYPNPGKKSHGRYSISTLSYNNQFNLSTAGKIIQTRAKEFQVSGALTSSNLPDLKMQFTSIAGLGKNFYASIEFKTNPVKLNNADIENFIPQKFQTKNFEVTASSKGNATFLNHQLKTFLRLNIKDGKIHMPDTNFTATGINTTMEFNDLLALESVPGQVITIDSIKVDKVKIKDAKIRFTIENGKSLLIENIRFKWCDGLVSTESIRFPQDNNDYSLTLYCDRLGMAQVLKQMGAFDAKGSGTLTGRIPVMYNDGNISFDNGFLFSNPGSGGKVVIKNTDRITAGIPMKSPQFAQLDLAQEALKAFDYKWAKFIFNTFEDTLYVNMKLDGKPSKVLPFEYKKELGSFIRVDASSPGSRFQGIKLDVNLKLSFNEVIKFGNKLKSLLN